MQIKRRESIDVARGIAILTVVLGHTINIPCVRGLIYSFHMPLFFILSGAVLVPVLTMEQWKNRVIYLFKTLFFYAMAGYSILLLLLYLSQRQININGISDYLKSLLFSCGVTIGNIKPIWMVWFLVAFVIGESLFLLISLRLSKNKKLYCFVICALSLIGVLQGYLHLLPFDLDIALSVLVFFAVGRYIREEKLKRKAYFFLVVFAWIVSFFIYFFLTKAELVLAARSYPMYPLCFLCAYMGTESVLGISIRLKRFPRLFSVLSYIGKNSLIFLMVHYFDVLWDFYWSFPPQNVWTGQVISGILRLAIDLFIFWLVMEVRKRFFKHGKAVAKA